MKNPKTVKTVAFIIGLLVAFIVGALYSLTTGWLISNIWNDFIAQPMSLPKMPLLTGIGISILASLILPRQAAKTD